MFNAGVPILQLSQNNHDPNQVALVLSDSENVVLFDQRVPSVPLSLLPHSGQVNSVAFSPVGQSKNVLATVSDD
jgi:WD40 repeat protein